MEAKVAMAFVLSLAGNNAEPIPPPSSRPPIVETTRMFERTYPPASVKVAQSELAAPEPAPTVQVAMLRTKTCHCSGLCACGCNAGFPCSCPPLGATSGHQSLPPPLLIDNQPPPLAPVMLRRMETMPMPQVLLRAPPPGGQNC